MYLPDSHILLPSYRYALTKSWGGFEGTGLGLANEESGKLVYCGLCYLQIPNIFSKMRFSHNGSKVQSVTIVLKLPLKKIKPENITSTGKHVCSLKSHAPHRSLCWWHPLKDFFHVVGSDIQIRGQRPT